MQLSPGAALPPQASTETDLDDHNERIDQPTPPKSRIFRRFSVELGCLLCSRTLGTIESTTWPVHGPVVLTRPEGLKAQIADWLGVRCDNCGGSVLPTDVTLVEDRVERPHDWSQERPRRGRPPKRLVKQRSPNGTDL